MRPIPEGLAVGWPKDQPEARVVELATGIRVPERFNALIGTLEQPRDEWAVLEVEVVKGVPRAHAVTLRAPESVGLESSDLRVPLATWVEAACGFGAALVDGPQAF